METPLKETGNDEFDAFCAQLQTMRMEFRAMAKYGRFAQWDEEERREWVTQALLTADLLVHKSNELLQRLPMQGINKIRFVQA